MDGKFLSDCELTSYMLDKHVVLTRGGGEDYKISFKDLIDNIKSTLLRDYLKSKIGNIHINTNNKYRDNAKYNDGYIEYLMLNGQEINKKEYPDLFKALEIEEEKYSLPNYWQEEGGCTLKHVKEGNGRALNSYEKDSIKEHGHTLNLNLETETFDIDLNHNHFFRINGHTGDISYHGGNTWANEAFKLEIKDAINVGESKFIQQFKFCALRMFVEKYTEESSKKRSDPINVKIKPYKGSTGLTGQKENTVKNVAVQCYIAAKVLV